MPLGLIPVEEIGVVGGEGVNVGVGVGVGVVVVVGVGVGIGVEVGVGVVGVIVVVDGVPVEDCVHLSKLSIIKLFSPGCNVILE